MPARRQTDDRDPRPSVQTLERDPVDLQTPLLLEEELSGHQTLRAELAIREHSQPSDHLRPTRTRAHLHAVDHGLKPYGPARPLRSGLRSPSGRDGRCRRRFSATRTNTLSLLLLSRPDRAARRCNRVKATASPPSGSRAQSPRSKRVRPGLGTTAFVLVPGWAGLSQRRLHGGALLAQVGRRVASTSRSRSGARSICPRLWVAGG